MKITFCCSNKEKRKFIEKELALCINIQDKNIKQQVRKGLSKILGCYKTNTGYFYDGDTDDLEIIQPYHGEFIYHCGNEFKLPKQVSKSKYLLCVMDADSCIIGKLNGKRIEVIYKFESNVPRKVNGGGQSKVRYAQNRENALTQWYKKCADKLFEIYKKENEK